MAKGILVTRHEPTPDQKNVVRSPKYERTVSLLSYDEFRSKLFDSTLYISNRESKRFGSVYDHVNNIYEIPPSDFVEPTISDVDSSTTVSFSQLVDDLREGKRCVLTAEYGVGKSMVMRHLFYRLVCLIKDKEHFRTPIAINLREHIGQSDPVELLERHARANAVDPQRLVAAWNAGFVDLLIDGFDELSTRGWTGDPRRLREYRRTTHSVVRKLIKETPSNCSIFLAGRDGYFDSTIEMRDALGVPYPQFSLRRILPFDDNQASEFLRKKGITGLVPDWLPTRPLLLSYLAAKKLFGAVAAAETAGDFQRGASWLTLIRMIAKRESEQLEGVDKDALLRFLGALAIHSRQTPGGQTSFSPQQMERLFSVVTDATITEDELHLLLRLPGLGAAQDPSNRSFIDFDFMNACCAFPTFESTINPYLDTTGIYRFEELAEPMTDVGVEALASLLAVSGTPSGTIFASVDQAIRARSSQLAFDIFRAGQKLGSSNGFKTFSNLTVHEVDLVGNEYDGAKVDFSECIIDRVHLPAPDETNVNVVFSDCLIGRVEGRVSVVDLDKNQFIECEISEFTDEFDVNSAVLDSSLPLSVRVLVVTLRKLFMQSGAARLESALFRGLDQRAKLVVSDVVTLLVRHGFTVKSTRRGKITYVATKSKRREALGIIQSPNNHMSEILRECRLL